MKIASEFFTNGKYVSEMEKKFFDGRGVKSETSSAARSLAQELAQIVVSEIQKIISENPGKQIRFVSGNDKRYKTSRKVVF